MKLFKFKSILKMKFKRYLLYAIGEILLVVVGILLALYINNLNNARHYRSKIDTNILRVYNELEENIKKTGNVIEQIQQKDSTIYLVMNDSVKIEDYQNHLDLSLIISNNHASNLSDEAFQNLIQLNSTDSRYQDELILNIKNVYAVLKKIEFANKTMSDFLTNESIPFLAKNMDSFGEFIFRGVVNNDDISFFINSSEYKKYVGRYAVYAIRNQLRNDQIFYTKAIDVYQQIGIKYNLTSKDLFDNPSFFLEYAGLYSNELSGDTMEIRLQHDSLFFYRNDTGINLTTYNESRFYIDRENSTGEFISFFKTKDQSGWYMKTHLLSIDLVYEKIKK